MHLDRADQDTPRQHSIPRLETADNSYTSFTFSFLHTCSCMRVWSELAYRKRSKRIPYILPSLAHPTHPIPLIWAGREQAIFDMISPAGSLSFLGWFGGGHKKSPANVGRLKSKPANDTCLACLVPGGKDLVLQALKRRTRHVRRAVRGTISSLRSGVSCRGRRAAVNRIEWAVRFMAHAHTR